MLLLTIPLNIAAKTLISRRKTLNFRDGTLNFCDGTLSCRRSYRRSGTSAVTKPSVMPKQLNMNAYDEVMQAWKNFVFVSS
jgi:hypothetical protein